MGITRGMQNRGVGNFSIGKRGVADLVAGECYFIIVETISSEEVPGQNSPKIQD